MTGGGVNGGIHASQPVLHGGASIADADNVVILLHGRGASARDIFTLGPELAPDNACYLAPQAAGHTWYPNSFLAQRGQNEPYLTSALEKIKSILQGVLDAGVPAEDVIFCGFSQGACLATEFLATYPRRYGGLAAFTGGLIGPPGADLTHPGDLAGTPVFLGSGDPDPHVPWHRVEESAVIFRNMNAGVTLKRYPGLPHTISREELDAARIALQL